MSRSLRKGPYVDEKLMKKALVAKNEGSRTSIKTWARGSQIAPEMVGLTLSIHNGKKFIDVFITEPMVGHHVGEFAPTRTFRSHGRITDRTVTPT